MRRIFLTILLLIFITPNICLADDDLLFEELEPFSYPIQSTSSDNSISTYSNNIVVFDRKTKLVLFDKNYNEKVPMASTTKIMTCILALENLDYKKNPVYSISESAASATGSTLGLKYNNTISLEDLLYGLMLRSGNDCAILLAEIISENIDNFSKLMNDKASSLGLKNSNFITPHGLDDKNHYSTAYDLAILTDYALQNDTFRKIVSTKSKTIVLNGTSTNINNTNELLGNFDGIYGVKTGFTFGAGRCLISAYKNDTFDIIIVVLGANSKSIRAKDTKTVINYINKNFKYINLENVIKESFELSKKDIYKLITLEKTTDIPEFYLDEPSNYNFPIKLDGKQVFNTKLYLTPKLSNKTKKDSIIRKSCFI